ncbi:MAG: phage head-tail connector protein [Proteobacteria bacterium]|nr:phage head-tail connector protein [Pseudomonadota bacterium]
MRPLPVRVEGPAIAPVTLAELKAHLRIDFDDEDAPLAVYLAAAVAHFDGWSGVLGRCLINQQWRIDFPAFPCGGVLALPFPDVSLAAIAYSDAVDVDQALAASAYRLVQLRGGAVLALKSGATWPETAARPDAVRVTFTAGFGAAAPDVPASIRTAIMLRAGDLYLKREDSSKTGGLVETLISPYCRTGLGPG